MANDALPRLREIFDAANELPQEERPAYLDRACGNDAELRERVEALLAAAGDDDPFLSEPTAALGATGVDDAGSAEAPGSVIGRYKLLEQIGEGGFGTVFMAEQEHPVRRRVALKVIKPGMDTRQVIARFEAERQALAMMDHTGIARVFDAGATDSGRPYFVMELVRGEAITTYCDHNDLTTRERLDLFTQVCHAVQHAHQKGIIHRDIKPNNVMITVADGKPIPKVIDFGIAKATASKLTEKTLFTEHRALIGTPAYMSPEQADMAAVDVDTRTDIYSLGVLLYQLLTGTTPFDTKALMAAGMAEIQRIIREEEPEKPSTRLSTLRGTQPNGALQRKAESGRLSALVRGDLDWIVMKALEKERSRRYETANGLAADVQRFLSGEPVVAAPPSRLYRFRKFARRNRVAMVASIAVAASLVTGLTLATYGFITARGERDQKITALGKEREARELAEEREEQTQQVSEFQAAMLSEIDVEAMGRGIKERFREQVEAALERQYVGEFPDRRKRTREEIEAELAAFDQRADAAQAVDVARRMMDEFVLARAAAALEEEFADQPLVRTQIHLAIGGTYLKLGLYSAAEPHLRAALTLGRDHHGPENAHAHVAECLHDLAHVLDALGDRPEAEALYRESLAMWRELSNDEQVARNLEALAGLAIFQRRFADADSLLSEALRLNRELFGEDDVPVVANTLGVLAVLRTKQRRLPEAEDLNRQVLQMRRDHFGDHHPKVSLSLHNLAHVLMRLGRHAEAEESFRESLTIKRAVYGDEHPLVAMALYYHGSALLALGRRADGEALYRQALVQQRKLLGDHHPEVRVTLRDLAVSRSRAGDHAEAVLLLREALEITELLYPDGHGEAWRRFSTMSRLGGTLAGQAKALLSTDRERALAVFEEAEPLIIGGRTGLQEEERDRGLNIGNKRRSLERTIADFEFWHNVAPDRGWGDRAAEWRAELEDLPRP